MFRHTGAIWTSGSGGLTQTKGIEFDPQALQTFSLMQYAYQCMSKNTQSTVYDE